MNKLIVGIVTVLVLGTSAAWAETMNTDTSQAQTQAVEVGNKICPITGNPVDDGSMGEPGKYEYKGKIYTLCCTMCVTDFKKDPEKYSKIADEEVKKSAGNDMQHKHDDGHDHQHTK